MALFQLGVHTNASLFRFCDNVQAPSTTVKSTPVTRTLTILVGVVPAVTALVTLPPASPIPTMVTVTSLAGVVPPANCVPAMTTTSLAT